MLAPLQADALTLPETREWQLQIIEKLKNSKKSFFENEKKLETLNTKIINIEGELHWDKKDFFMLLTHVTQSQLDLLEYREKYNNLEYMSHSEVAKFRSAWFKIIKLDKNWDFTENWTVKHLEYSQYFKVQEWMANAFKNRKWIIVSTKDGYGFVEEYKIHEKIPYYKLHTKTHDFYDLDKWYISWHNEYYNYKFDKYYYLEDKYGLWQDVVNGKKLSELLLVKMWDKYVFADVYERQKIANKKYIKDLKNRGYILKSMSERAWNTYNAWEVDSVIEEIYLDTQKVIKGLASKEEKIKAIYAFVLDRVEYDVKGLNEWDKRVYSGLETYKRRAWVCDWYTRLMAIMLSFAWIYDFELKRWYPIADENFLKIGHAWLKIWDKYYDPTFDDPIGIKESRSFSEYQYFALPKDLYYIDRTDWLDTAPLLLRAKSLKAREEYVAKKYFSYIDKKWSDFRLLKYYNNLKLLGVNSEGELTTSNLANIFKKADFMWNKLYIDWKRVSSYKYFTIRSNLDLKGMVNVLPVSQIWNIYYSLNPDNRDEILIIHEFKF